KVIASSRKASVSVLPAGSLKVKVDAPPQKGKANRRLLEILAGYYGVPKTSVKIIHGHTSPVKLMEIFKP
ncbi:MAG: DUF167 domain-containing protein, partial [bacterium]